MSLVAFPRRPLAGTVVLATAGALSLLTPTSASAARVPDPVVYSTPGDATYTVPDGVTVIDLALRGGGGGGGGGGFGGFGANFLGGGKGGGGGAGATAVECRLEVKPGQKLMITVGDPGPGGPGIKTPSDERFVTNGTASQVLADGERQPDVAPPTPGGMDGIHYVDTIEPGTPGTGFTDGADCAQTEPVVFIGGSGTAGQSPGRDGSGGAGGSGGKAGTTDVLTANCPAGSGDGGSGGNGGPGGTGAETAGTDGTPGGNGCVVLTFPEQPAPATS
ncbi:hypothetical protein [Streptomyces sp. NPDC051554]|uniref:glycine-rich domain-containing protein n=1 Tax=Streptomyces sp. NPDC051554 TaxID=3365656 RepID=UPI00378BA71D